MKITLRYLAILCFLFLTTQVLATEMESPNYKLESGSVNMSTEEETMVEPEQDATEKINTILTPQQLERYQTQEYISLHNNTDTNEQLTFTLSNGTVEFNNLNTNLIQEKKISLNSSTTVPLSTNLYIRQESPFANTNGDEIPNSMCQKTSNICTSTTAREWTDKEVFGLGYKLAGNNKPIDFLTEKFYRSLDKPLSVNNIMTYNSLNNSGAITFKLNVPLELSESSFETIVSLLVLPQPY